MLQVLGLAADEERAYRHLVGLASASAADVSGLLGVDRVSATTVLTGLEAKGLVARSTAGPDRYVASPPAVALGALLVEQHDDLKHAQSEIDALARQYAGGAGRRTVNDVVDVVSGPEAVAQRFLQLHRTAQRDIQALVKSDVSVVAPEQNPEEEAAIARGVAYRVVVERGLLDRPGFFASARESIQAGVQARVAQTLPLRMIIMDRQLALVPLMPDRDRDPAGGALLIHPSGLLDALQGLFDLVWEVSSRLVVGPDAVAESNGDELDDIDAQVLSLLFAGLTDQAIGRQLDMSLRTVQRRVRALMDRAHVETRMQLGHEAGRRGWL